MTKNIYVGNYTKEAIINILNTEDISDDTILMLTKTIQHCITDLNMSPNDIKKTI